MNNLTLFTKFLVPLAQLLEVSAASNHTASELHDHKARRALAEKVANAREALNLLAVRLSSRTEALADEQRAAVAIELQRLRLRAIANARGRGRPRSNLLTKLGLDTVLEGLCLDMVPALHKLAQYDAKKRHSWMARFATDNPLVINGRTNAWKSLVKRLSMAELEASSGASLRGTESLVPTNKGSEAEVRVQKLLALLEEESGQPQEASLYEGDLPEKLPPEVTLRTEDGQVVASVTKSFTAEAFALNKLKASVGDPKAVELIAEHERLGRLHKSVKTNWAGLDQALRVVLGELQVYVESVKSFEQKLQVFVREYEIQIIVGKLRKQLSAEQLEAVAKELSKTS